MQLTEEEEMLLPGGSSRISCGAAESAAVLQVAAVPESAAVQQAGGRIESAAVQQAGGGA